MARRHTSDDRGVLVEDADTQTAFLTVIDASVGPIGPNELESASNGWFEPVIMRNLCSTAIERGTWSLEHILSLEPDATVTTEYYHDGDRRKPYKHVTKKFSELYGPMSDEPTKWFIAERNFDTEFPKLASSLQRLPVIPQGVRHLLRLVFFGTDTQSATHFHVRDQAILTQLRGRKRVILSGPKTTDRMATNSTFGARPQFSTHGPATGEDSLESFVGLLGADDVVVADLAPGDSLFIPVHWWHWAEGFGESLSVTSFWRASLKQWVFPAPGFRAISASLIAQAASIARPLIDRVKAKGG